MRRLAAFGFLLVTAMQVIFFATGGDRPFPYREVQALSILGTLAMAWGALRGEMLPLALGAGVNLLARVLQPLLGLTRLPLWANALLSLGWAWMLLDASRGSAARAGAWLLGAAHFLAALTATARLLSVFALCLGAVGLLLAAPSLREP